MGITYNVITHGNLINTNGVLSNFSASNYATFNADTFADTNIELFFKAKFNSITSDSQVVYSFYDDSHTYSLCDIGLFGDKFYFEIGNGEASLGDITGTTTAVANTDYYIKVIRNGNTYTLYLSTDGTTWTTEGFLTTTNHPSYTSAMNYLGGFVTSDGIDQIINGSINLNGSYIKLNGNYIWQGVTSTSNVRTRIQLRHDTATNWASVNPILLVGEVGIETDTRKQKFGDGSTSWNSLPYDANSTALNSKANTDLSNLSSTGKAVIDGQWNNSNSGNIINGSNITWTTGHNYDLSSYLPNDGKIYEVIFTASWTGSTAGANHDLRASTDIITSAWNWLGRVSGTNVAAGSCILPVGSGRYVKLTTGASACNSVYFSALGYRRLGTNS